MNNISSTANYKQQPVQIKYATRSAATAAAAHPAHPPASSPSREERQIVPVEKPSSAAFATTPQAVFVEKVKKWVMLENELKKANETTRHLRETKAAITNEICEWMKSKDMEKRTIKVSDGELRFYDKKDYSPLSYGYVESCLLKIIQDEKHVELIIKYLKDNREITTSTDIRHVVKG
jgi:hypothetical protein